MSFDEQVKKAAREKARYACVWCQRREYFLEVHHIVPQEEGGPNTLDNAAPVCPQCHTHIGPNRDLRKQLRERRDWWWHECEGQTLPAFTVGLFEQTNKLYAKVQSMEAQGQRTEGTLRELKSLLLDAEERRRAAISAASSARQIAQASTSTSLPEPWSARSVSEKFRRGEVDD